MSDPDPEPDPSVADPGCLSQIPDPENFRPGSRISDPKFDNNTNLKLLNVIFIFEKVQKKIEPMHKK
jgi:hypothetical protein